MAASLKYRYIGWLEIHRALSVLAEQVRRNYQPDTIITIVKGGLIPARIIGDLLGIDEIGYVGVKFYKGVEKRGEKPFVTFTALPRLDYKKILIVDDVIESGRTISTVVDLVSKYNYSGLKALALFVKPWSPVKPDYYYEVVDKWVVFPWEVCETLREGLNISQVMEDPTVLDYCTVSAGGGEQ
ncbi:MAG: phosphoribosyltransferase [Thermosphaera sp.]